MFPPYAYNLLIAAGAVLAALLLTRRWWSHAVGPLLPFEIVRLARQRRAMVLRCVYILGLLAVLYAVFPASAQLSLAKGEHPGELNHFAAKFSQVFLFAQAVLILFITPIYLAGAITEEKEKRTLDFLLLGQLTGREIVLGKLGARLAILLSILLAGIPVLALTQLWGGVDIVRIGVGTAATGLSAWSLGGISIACSVFCRRTVAAVASAYLIGVWMQICCLCFPISHLSSPIALEQYLEKYQAGAGAGSLDHEALKCLQWYALFHGILGSVGIAIAAAQLRGAAQPPEPLLLPPINVPPPPELAPVVMAYAPQRRWSLPPIHSNPVLWKERYVGRMSDGPAVAEMAWMLFFVVVVVTSFAVLHPGSELAHPQSFLRHVFHVYFAIPAMILLIGLAFRLARSVSREREQQTLDGLLVLPLDRRQILTSKWLGCLARGVLALWAVGVVLLAGILCGAFSVLSAVALALALAAHALFVGNLALLLSIVCRSTLRAQVTALLILCAMFLGGWLAGYFGNKPEIGYALGPIQTWVRLSIGARWISPDECDAVWLALGPVVYLLSGWLLWRLALYFFRREPAR
jgi:ABC-type transport system involved in multi-copper enzyme maturation permease subunit